MSVGDFLRRTEVSRPTVEKLAHAGAFDAFRQQDGNRRDRLYMAMTTDADRPGEQLSLVLDGEPTAVGLRDYTAPEVVRAELEVVGMDASQHLLTFYEGTLEELGVTRSRDLASRRGGENVMVAGVKVSSQTPAVRSGQRIIFLTLDDATGPIEVTVFERVQDRVARTVFHFSMLAVWGRLRRTGVRGASIIAEEVWDLALLDGARREGKLREALAAGAANAEGATPDVPPSRPPVRPGGSARWEWRILFARGRATPPDPPEALALERRKRRLVKDEENRGLRP